MIIGRDYYYFKISVQQWMQENIWYLKVLITVLLITTITTINNNNMNNNNYNLLLKYLLELT